MEETIQKYLKHSRLPLYYILYHIINIYFEGNCVDLELRGYGNKMVKKISLRKYFTHLFLQELFTLFHYVCVCVCVKNYEEFT